MALRAQTPSLRARQASPTDVCTAPEEPDSQMVFVELMSTKQYPRNNVGIAPSHAGPQLAVPYHLI